MNKIGGEFGFEFKDNFFDNKLSSAIISSGRHALFLIIDYLIKNNGIKSILIPDYICSSVTTTLKLFDITLFEYKVEKDFSFNICDSDLLLVDSILFVNYFGLLDLNYSINHIRKRNDNIIIIEDNVQAFWEMEKSSGSDFSFTSIRKTFPLHEGAIIKNSKNIDFDKILEENSFSRLKWEGALIKSLSEVNKDIPDSEYLAFFEEGEVLLDNTKIPQRVSALYKKYSQTIDTELCRKIRIENSKYILNRLKENQIKIPIELKDGKVPLFIPVLIKNRDSVRRKLFEHNIFLPVHWPDSHSEISKNELSVVIDHRYNTEDMKYVVEKLIKAIKEFE